MNVVKHIICELTGYRPGAVDVSQGDRQSRVVSCRLLENGAPWMIPEGATARVAYTLPDGTEGLYDSRPDGTPMWKIAGNIVTVELADQLMAQAGMAQVSILIIGPEGGQLAAWPIRVCVTAHRAAQLTVPEGLPAFGSGYEGRIFYGGPGGTVMPLDLGPGLEASDGVLQLDPAADVGKVKSVGGVGPDGTGNVPLDWVATRTVRIDQAGEALVPEVVMAAGISKAFNYDTIAGQEELAVLCDGKLYLCSPKFDSEGSGDYTEYYFHLGNASLRSGSEPNTGEPFFFYGYSGATSPVVAYFITAGEHTVEIYGGKEVLIYNKLPEEYLPDGVVRTVNGVAPDENGNVNVDGAGSGQSVSQNRKYVEEFKTSKNTWNDAFAELFAYCQENGCVACTGGTQYVLTAPLYIGDIDVDFESCELYNNVAESENNPACVVLTGAQKRIQKFGTVTGRQSIGILVNTANGLYKFNRLYAKLIQGWSGALWLSTTNNTCCFNEFHVPLLKSADVALKTWCKSRKTKWVNECHFYLASIELYRSTYPTKLIEMTNATRCNIYNVDLECGDWQTPDPNRTVEVELTDCSDVAFYNPRTKENFNAVQFRFIGECYDNYIDAEYSKFGTIDSSQMVLSDRHYNVWRGRAVTNNAGSTTNASTLRIYKDMLVPEMLTRMTADVTAGITVASAMFTNLSDLGSGGKSGGIPTLMKWSGGNITIDGRFIALLPATIQIMRTSDGVGNILDMDGNVIMVGAELTMGARYDICVDSVAWAVTEPVGENAKKYPYIAGTTLDIVCVDAVSDAHINSLINTALGVIENGTY